MRAFILLLASCLFWTSSALGSDTGLIAPLKVFCNVNSAGQVFYFDIRGSQYNKYGQSYPVGCITPSFKEVTFNCFNVPSEFASSKLEIVRDQIEFFQKEKNFETKRVVLCEISPELLDLWQQTASYKPGRSSAIGMNENDNYAFFTHKSGKMYIYTK
jgi:hypothetical protein